MHCVQVTLPVGVQSHYQGTKGKQNIRQPKNAKYHVDYMVQCTYSLNILFLYTQSVRLLSIFSTVFLFRCPVTHNFSNTAATSTHLSNTALVSFAFFVTNRTQFYLLLLHCIVISIYACQGLRVPSKLVVARVCVDDSGAIIASRDFGSALWICLGGNRGDKRHQSGNNQLHDGFVMMNLSLCKSC